MTKVFVDGREGTTGLRIAERLEKRPGMSLIVLPEEKRKDPEARREAIFASDVTFLCLPDAAAEESARLAEGSRAAVIDASTAHRTLPGWEYGFPELDGERAARIAASKRIAVPGCHASGFIALVQPLVKRGIIDKDAALACTSITGYSGGGKKMIAQYGAAAGALAAPRQYGLTQQHKHLKEMTAVTGLDRAPVFCPVVADFYSGMEVIVPLSVKDLKGGASAEDVKDVYRGLYGGRIVFFRENCDEEGFLSAGAYAGKDCMEISVHGNDERIVLVARYDNLGKGASGAAVECMNLVLGLPPETGLEL